MKYVEFYFFKDQQSYYHLSKKGFYKILGEKWK